MKKIFTAAIFGAVMAASFSAQAEGMYVGVNVGQSKQEATSGGTSASENKTGAKVYGGYAFNKTFGAEVGYTEFGNISQSFNDGVNYGSLGFKTTSLYIAGTATAPINDRFSVFAKLGLAENRVKSSASLNGASASVTDTNTDAMIGVGASYSINKDLSAVAEYENFGKVLKTSTGNVKADMFSVGLRYKF
jgi:OOP family OmpA-OmpF porin